MFGTWRDYVYCNCLGCVSLIIVTKRSNIFIKTKTNQIKTRQDKTTTKTQQTNKQKFIFLAVKFTGGNIETNIELSSDTKNLKQSDQARLSLK